MGELRNRVNTLSFHLALVPQSNPVRSSAKVTNGCLADYFVGKDETPTLALSSARAMDGE